MPDNPKVSICIPLYNGEAYLEECLASVAGQTFSDFEAILVDDSSSDRTFAIASAFAANDSRFRVHRNRERRGLVGNWNYSIELSRGEWVKLLFQDDLLDAECVGALLRACESHEHSFGFCYRHIHFENGVSESVRGYFKEHQDLLASLYRDRIEISAHDFAQNVLHYPDWNLIGEPTVTLFRRSLFERLGGFNPALVQMCDSEYWTRIGTNLGVAVVPETLATFRVHGASTTARNHAARAYRLSLEPITMSYLHLCDARYHKMRRLLYQRFGFAGAWKGLIRNTHLAWQSAHLSFQDADGDRQARQKDWEELAKIYPLLRVLAFLGIFSAWFRKIFASPRKRSATPLPNHR